MFYSVGFVGEGLFSETSDKRIYNAWFQILKRCYDVNLHLQRPTYIGCSVNEDWWNFQNFAHDYLQMSGHSLEWQLDKDILIKGNKLYSMETCCLVPQRINTILTKSNSSRGSLPIGVSRANSKFKPFQALLSKDNTIIFLGHFPTPELAFQAYKQAKESEIKRVANLYKFQLDPRTYKALINYNVEITD